jgi:poly-gamma-glutamate synthesis protein (capsule biosynthesis protein)
MRIAIAGDFAMNDGLRGPGRTWLAGSPSPGLDALREVFRSADFVVANFEASIPDDRERPEPSKILIRADEGSVAVARALGIHAMTLANNHAFDFGDSTCGTLRSGGIECFGAGKDEAEAAAPLRRRIANEEVAFIGWADRETIDGIWADDGTPGANAVSRGALIEQVRALAGEVDRVIVLPHWGRDYLEYPSPAMRDLALRLIDAGAAAVIGTHPHIVGCNEAHAGRPIVYSTGSLLLDDIRLPDGTMTVAYPPSIALVALLKLGPGGVEVDFVAFRCSRGTFQALPAASARAVLERNNRFLSGGNYGDRYDRYEARMRAWGIRLRTDVLGRPAAAAVRIGRKLQRRVAAAVGARPSQEDERS